MKKIVLLKGGFSGEREISIKSAIQINDVLNKKYDVIDIDPADYENYELMIKEIKNNMPFIVFNGLHGADGEDGHIQKLLEENSIPFTGSDSESSKIAMDKYRTGEIAKNLNIPVPKKILLKNTEELTQKELSEISYPVIIKPNSEGSSLGIFLIQNEPELLEKLNELKKGFEFILIEQYISGRELTVTVLGEKAYPVVEIKPKNGWYDFENKYTSGNTEYIAPADLTENESKIVQKFALSLFNKIGCKAYSRIDFRYDGEKFYLLEVNTLPGMTKLSLTPMSVKAAGIEFAELLERIIAFSL